MLKLDDAGGAPLLNIFGGKITTYRKLAEAALAKVAPLLGNSHVTWTADAPLPGGDFAPHQVQTQIDRLRQSYAFLDQDWATRLIRAYGTEAFDMIADATSVDALGKAFGHTVTATELDWAIAKEWVMSGEDFLWRRTRLGLVMSEAEAEAIDLYIREGAGKAVNASHA